MFSRRLLAVAFKRCPAYQVLLVRSFSASAKPEKQQILAVKPSNRPEKFCLDGLTLVPDEKWNLSDAVLKMLERRLLNEEGNPLNLLKLNIIDHFHSTYSKRNSPMFTVCESEPRAVSVWDNFDSLLTPLDHVSRRPSDTYYINDDHCLRAHTSAHESKLIKQGLDKFLTIGDVYRRDEIDRSHFPCFHQLEGVWLFSADELSDSAPGQKAGFILIPVEALAFNEVMLFEDGKRTKDKQETHTCDTAHAVTLHLQKMLERLCRHLFGAEAEMRWVDVYFPFTHPSFELEVLYDDKWMEVLGCGVLEQEILNNSGAGAKVGLAFGLGLERLAMVLYGIPDIRLFWSRDSGFLSQFAGKSPKDRFKYRPISSHPQVYFDLSFWLPDEVLDEEMTANTYDVIRSIGGTLIEQVRITDSFTHKKTGKRSQTYRLVYRSNERVLTKEECNLVHKQVETHLTEKYGVKIR